MESNSWESTAPSKSELIGKLMEAAARDVDNVFITDMLNELISKFYKAHLDLEEQEHIYRSTVTAMAEGVVIQNISGEIIVANPQAEEILGLTIDQMAGRASIGPQWKSIHEDGSPFPEAERPAMVTLRTGRAQHGVIMGVYKPKGGLVWISINSQPVVGQGESKPKMAVTTFTDVTEQKQWEEELKRISVTDHLTQIFNRVKLSAELRKEINRANRYQVPLSLIMFDIDHFKMVNDTHGHDIGDYVLVELVRIVKELIRDIDLLARWGGEEFMILLPSTTEEDAYNLAERARRRIEEAEFSEVESITCSFGVTEYIPSESEDEVNKRLDKALYQAKNSGRNRVKVF